MVMLLILIYLFKQGKINKKIKILQSASLSILISTELISYNISISNAIREFINLFITLDLGYT